EAIWHGHRRGAQFGPVRRHWLLHADGGKGGACTLARSPYVVTAIRRLQTLRLLHACSGPFRLERSPGGACTHWKAPPCHGARGKRSFTSAGWTARSRQYQPFLLRQSKPLG